MAILAHRISNHQVQISSQCLVGHSPDACVRLSNSAISAQHARISWLDSYWVVRDLGSDRGTYVNGARLDSGNDTRIVRGDTLRFGSLNEEFNLIDADAPRLSARRLTDHILVEASDAELCLPSIGHPEVRVFEDEHGRWTMVQNGRRHPVQNAELVVAGGEIYRLSLPRSPGLTRQASAPSVANINFEFRVSTDEEHVEVWLHRPNGQTEILPARAHYYTLLILARARLADRELEMPSEARGWRNSPELSRMLAVDESSINVHVHRIRKDLEALGFGDASKIISRQRSRRLVRINSPRLAVSVV